MSQLPHTIELKKGPFMRTFLWTYRPDVSSLNTCWLFWGFLFLPLILPLVALARGVAKFFGPPLDAIDERLIERKKRRNEFYEPTPPKPKKPGRFLPAVSNFFSKVWFKTAPVLPWIGKFFALAIVLIAAYLLIKYVTWAELLDFTVGMLIIAGIIVALVAVALTVGWLLFEKWDVGRAVKSGGRSFHQHTCANVRFAGEPTPDSNEEW